MATVLTFFFCSLVTSAYGASINLRDTQEIVNISTLLHTADHNVDSLGVLFNEDKQTDRVIFFIEADVNKQGKRVDYGLYALKKGVKTKLLDSARDIVIVNLVDAYFAGKDGIYVYNKQNHTAQKYGSINDDIISLAVENGTGGVKYYLNKQHQLYKVTEDGRKSVIVDAVRNAQEIVIDRNGYLYYYLADKTFYVYDGNRVKKINAVPNNLKKIKFIKNPIMVENCAIFNGDNNYYVIIPNNGTVESVTQEKFEATALSIDTGVIVYFAKDKKIYEFNIIEKMIEGIFEAISESLKIMIQNIRDTFNSIGVLGANTPAVW